MGKKRISSKQRLLGIYSKLMGGSVINKAEETCRYGVTEKSIERDFAEMTGQKMDIVWSGCISQSLRMVRF